MYPVFVKTTKGIYVNANYIYQAWETEDGYCIQFKDAKGMDCTATISIMELAKLVDNE